MTSGVFLEEVLVLVQDAAVLVSRKALFGADARLLSRVATVRGNGDLDRLGSPEWRGGRNANE